jgi:hypothetical protein
MKTIRIPETDEAAILERVIEPNRPGLSVAAARAILQLDFAVADRERMHLLAQKNQRAELTPEETQEIDSYCRVGAFLSLLKSKARRSLKKTPKRA